MIEKITRKNACNIKLKITMYKIAFFTYKVLVFQNERHFIYFIKITFILTVFISILTMAYYILDKILFP